MTRTTSWIWIALVLSAPARARALADEPSHTKTPLDQVKSEVSAKKAVLVDVREPSEWDKGHVLGAVSLPLSRLSQWDRDGLSEADRAELARLLPKKAVVYCHCAAGGRSLPAGSILRKLGYDARSLQPGYKALVEAGFTPAPAK